MRCSSCIGSSRRSQSSDDHESTSALRQSKTADLELDHSGMDQPHHRSSPPQCTAYRVDSPTAKQEDAHSSTASHSEHYRPPSITIEELDDNYDNAVEYGAETLGTASASTAIRNYEVQPSRGGPLEIIREEEHTDCSDGENSHILPSSDSATVRPLPQKECKSTKVNKTSGDENGAECVTTKFNSVNVLRDFLRYRRQRKRRRGTSAIQNAAPQFQPSEQQVPTTCMLVDARESNIAPTEFRSICTTEIVSSEVLQVEVVNIGSNSSSLDDLSDLEQEGHPDPENLVFIDHIEDDSDNAIHPDPDSDSNQQHCVIVGDASNSTLSLSNEDLRQTTEDEEQPPASSDGTVQNHVPTDDGRSLGENLPTLSEDRAALAQQDNLQRTQMSDSGTVDDLANGCALTTTAAGDVETGHREERHDEVSDAAENMSEQRHTFESNGEPDSTVVGWSTVERSSASVLVADRDRTSAVVSNDENVIKPLKDPPSSVIDRDCAAKFGIDCTVNHSVRVGKTPSVIEQTMHPGDKFRAAAPAAASATSTGAIIVQKENQTARSSPPPAARSVAQVAPGTAIPLPPPPKQGAASVTNLGQHPVVSAEDGKSDAPTPPVPPPPPAQQLVPLTVEALSSSSTAGYNPSANNAQALSSDHPSQTDHAHADQDSAENCVDAVTSVEQQQQQQDSLLNGSTVDGQSTLLKYIQAHSAAAEDSSEKRYQGKTQNSAKVAPVSTGGSDSKRHQTDHPIPVRSDAASPGEGNADREAKIEQTCEDHGGQNSGDSYEHTVLRVAPNLRNTDHETPRTGSDTGMNNVARKKRPSKFVEPTAPSRAERVSNLAHNTSTVQSKQEPTTEDLRSEISRMKDQELQDEFRKLELETARYERELQQITLPLQESHQQTNGKYSKQYFVSKQNDFVIERSSLSSVKTSNMVGVTNGGVSQSDIRKHGERVAGAQQETKSCTEQRPVPVPPPPPAAASTDSSIDNEEFFTKKVKDRVRDLMASQAAAEEAKNAAKMRAGGGFASAPSTPTASRKHIEADFKEFREMRQREAFAERKSLETTNNVPAKPQQQQQQHQPRAPTVRNFSPSRIPLATSKTSFVLHRKTNDAQGSTSTAKEPSPESKAQTAEATDAEEIKVNVAALIATHQEKQQLSTLPPNAHSSSKVAAAAPTQHVEPAVQNGPASDELVVSVSDKCQQFEQRIRQNSLDAGVCDVTNPRRTCPSDQPLQPQKPGTTHGIYGDVCCDAVDNGSLPGIDLLHEIDHALVLAKDFLFTRGVWSPFNRSTEVLTKEELAERTQNKSSASQQQQPAVWTPRSAPPSPLSERREFRRIGFETPPPTQRTSTPTPANAASVVTPPWNQPGYNPPLAVSEQPKPISGQSSGVTGPNAIRPTPIATTPPPPPPGQGGYQVRFPRSTNSQEPTINSLLKSKDGKTATINGSATSESLKKGSTITASTIRTSSSLTKLDNVVDTSYASSQPPPIRPKPEPSSATLHARSDSQERKMQQSAPKVEGIGPISREGMPLTLRSEIDEGNRDKWYKQMYQTLHKTHDDGYPYKSTGYQSEPEANYDSDYTIKYSTLDRRRTPVGLSPTSYNKFSTQQSAPTTPQPYHHQQSVKSGHSAYKNQPGRIEDYTPGRSSISEKESKEWWDEVMDIFNGQLEHQKLTTSKTYTEGNLSRALKEQGYESDSTLVFRKREPTASAALSPVEQKQHYKTMQAGGEIPLQGFRKPAPERPKDRNEEAIESDLVVEIKENNCDSNSNIAYAGDSNTIACYPITNIHRPLDMFGSFPKESRTFVPPVPPSRKSSRSNSTLKIMAQVKTNTFNRRTMLERTTTTTTSAANPHKFRSKSAGPLLFGGGATSSSSIMSMSASMMKEEKNQENNTRVASKRSTVAAYRAGSSSPTGQARKPSQSPVAFGRGISKERTFAEEKKRIEEKLPKIVSVSTSILRNPELKSPNEVKKALRSSYLPIVGKVETAEGSSLKRFSSSGTYRSASSIYSSDKSLNRVLSPASNHKKEEKSFKVSIATAPSSKGKDTSLQKRSLNRKSNTGRAPTITIKTSFQKASKAFGLKTTSSSNQSLARSCSTYSIDSTASKSRRSRISYAPSASNTLATTRNYRQTPQRVVVGSSFDRGIKTLKTKSPAVGIQQSAYSQSIVQQKENLRSDAFFQKLFLQTSSPNFDTDEKPPTSVLEKAHHWNKLTCRSEPSLKQSNYYLTQAKPVSSSKFKTKDNHDSAKVATEYQTVRQVGPDVIEQVHRFESMMKLTEDQPEDQQNQFGYVRGRRMEIDFSFHERSRSEPPAQTMTTTTTTTTSTTIQEELIGTDSPRTIVGRRCQIAQRTSRSPSCRRIQYLKGKEGQVKKIIRARSLSGNAGQRERGAKSKDELVRSHSLNLSQEPLVSRSRFRDLNNFYNSLERLGQLERVTSSSSNDLRPSRRTREEEIIDYDLWKRVRDQEKAERELNQLKSKLKQDQREKDLFFLPRDPEDVRWRSDQDTGLRNREKSVEDLKCILNEQALNFEDAKLRDLENRKDYYKPLWRGSSVIDVASHLEEKYSTTGEKRDEPQSLDIISSNLLSTLSFEQMKKLKNQLSEIYSTGTQKDPTTVCRATAQVHQQEEYVINVPERVSRLETLLKVRSHSVLTQDKINESHLRTQVTAFGKKSSDKSDRVLPKKFESNSLPSKAVDREALSRTLCQELKDKILEKHHTLPSIGKKKKHARPTILTTETSHFLSLDSNLKKASDTKPAPQPSRDVARKEREKEFEVIVRNEPSKSYCDTESISSETSNKTVIFRSQSMAQAVDVPPVEDIKTKIKYFEEKQAIDETPTVTIYHAREDSSLSENESGPQRDDEHGKTIAAKGTCSSMITLSQSFTDLKDLFGEKRSVSCSTYTASTSQDSKRSSARKLSPKRFTLRSRSTTPDYATCIQTGEVKKIKDKFESLDVNIWRQSAATSASPERQYQSDSELGRHPSGEDEKKTNDGTGMRQCKAATGSTIVRHHESGDVSRITHKYEAQSERARTRKSRKERVISPIPKNPFRKDDRFMPHINVISKTASLKREIKPTRTSNTHQPAAAAKQQPAAVLQSAQLPNVSAGSNRRSASSGSEEFEKLKSKFESGEQLSLLGKMYTSVPDIRELKDISGYLSGAWIAHQFPRPTDNARSLAAPDQSPPGRQIVRKGSAPSPDRFHRHHSFRFHTHQPETLRMHSSPSPRQSSDSKTRHKRNGSDGVDGFLKQFYTPDGGDTPYHDQKDSWEKSRSRRRLEVEALWRKIQAMTGNTPTAGTDVPVDKPSVTFEESPRRYIESDVNIHYKTPIRFEYKEPIPDDELAHRQAEHMRRVYQEERRRKYMHELEDLHSRRHMDNILPSQKSPIPLNRYDDFAADLSPKPQIVQQPKTIARALYNFQGQSIRELSFRKGDIIYLRRQIDKNWYEGEHNATVGLLPANYIEIISRDNFNVRPLPKKPSREGKARAKFNFTAQTAVELSLLKGELVTLTRRVDDNWFEGKIGSKKGIFPVSYVEILTDIDGEESYDIEPIVSRPQSALGVTSQSSHALTTHYDNSHTNGRISPGVVRETKTIQKTEVLHVDTSNEPISYRALYNYKPQNTDELELLEGDVVYVLEKCDDGWYVGTSARTGCFGTFPGNYVSKM
ncbi:uncharacterized protein LOC118513600 isoform X3 [Anopheles stephensi]|uniref:uncharacterized protein LOC118513600 isoform X3 n=1 Tax=Anopheles stephensi TaxID=30069 RepID=UPI0016587749|nr:uncharacterized protein LOC118513600 isoform X3 [Anopheles stephensi]